MNIKMKLTENHKELVKIDEKFICPEVATDTCIADFFKTDNGKLYKFSSLCHGQLTTQVLLYKMLQELNMTEESDLKLESAEEKTDAESRTEDNQFINE